LECIDSLELGLDKLGFSASFCWMIEAFFKGLHTKEEEGLGNDEE
jgi:hypothetical protein